MPKDIQKDMRVAIEVVHGYLLEHKEARKRSNKNRALVSLLCKVYHWNSETKITIEGLAQFVKDYSTYDRAWRKNLELHQELRGSDYDEGKGISLEKQRGLDYNV